MGTHSEAFQDVVSSDTLAASQLAAGRALWDGTGLVLRVQNPTTGANESAEIAIGQGVVFKRVTAQAAIAKGQFVVTNGTAGQVILASVDGGPVDGVAMDSSTGPGQTIRMAMSGYTSIRLGAGGLLAGDFVKTNNAGDAVAASTLQAPALPGPVSGSLAHARLEVNGGAIGTLVTAYLTPNGTVPGQFT